MKAMRRRPAKKINDDAWIQKHFEELVDKFPGQYVVVAEGEPFIGYDAAQLFKLARLKHRGVVPTCMPIPRPDDFASILLLCVE
jgi:hypothetical protein